MEGNTQFQQSVKRVKLNPYSTDDWVFILSTIKLVDIKLAREHYEAFLKVFPFSSNNWQTYAEHELKNENIIEAAQIYNRCLNRCLNVDLHKSYLKYLKDIKPKIETKKNLQNNIIKTPEEIEKDKKQKEDLLLKAYAYSLDCIGLDISSTDIWLEYFDLLKKKEHKEKTFTATEINQIKLLYRKALLIPMNDFEKIWKSFEDFEKNCTGSDQQTALQTINSQATRYKSTSIRFKQKKNARVGLLLNLLAKPTEYTINDPKTIQQKKIWKKMVNYEMSNSQALEISQVKKRVQFIYQQYLMCFYHHPDVWYDSIMYQINVNEFDKASEIFEKAIKLLPKSIILHLSYSHFEEKYRKNFEKSEQIYQRLIKNRDDTIVYIHFFRFYRRLNKNKKARELLVNLLQNKNCTYHACVSFGWDEYNQTNSSLEDRINIARRIFKTGFNKFPNNPNFIIQYIKFLEQINDKNNLKILLEKIIENFKKKDNEGEGLKKKDSQEIWNKFLQLEYNSNDFDTHVERRLQEQFPDDYPTNTAGMLSNQMGSFKSFVKRYKYLDLWPCSSSDLQIIDTKSSPNLFFQDIHFSDISKISNYYYESNNNILLKDIFNNEQNSNSSSSTTSSSSSSSSSSSTTSSSSSSFSSFLEKNATQNIIRPDLKYWKPIKSLKNNGSLNDIKLINDRKNENDKKFSLKSMAFQNSKNIFYDPLIPSNNIELHYLINSLNNFPAVDNLPNLDLVMKSLMNTNTSGFLQQNQQHHISSNQQQFQNISKPKRKFESTGISTFDESDVCPPGMSEEQFLKSKKRRFNF